MLVTRIVQKEVTFYFIAYKATDLLDRVSFTSRYYFEGERIEADEHDHDDVTRGTTSEARTSICSIISNTGLRRSRRAPAATISRNLSTHSSALPHTATRSARSACP